MAFNAKAATQPFTASLAAMSDTNGLGYGNLLRQDAQTLADLRFHLSDMEAQYATRYDDLNRKEKVAALFEDLGERPSLPESLEALVSMLPEGPAGQLLRIYNHVTRKEGETSDEPRTETVTLGDSDEDVTLEGMGDAALELNLSANERNEEYHGEFSFDGSGPAGINTFESEAPNPEYGSPTGTYRLPNSESVNLYVAEDTGFGGTIHADAAQSLEVDAPGFFSNTTLHGASLTEATFRIGFSSLYEDDVIYGGSYHRMDLDAENLERLTVTGDGLLNLTSIADSDALQRVDAVTDGFLSFRGFDLNNLEEVNLSGAGRVYFSTDELAKEAESINVDAGDLRGDLAPHTEDALSMKISEFSGPERGTAEIIGSEVGHNDITVIGRDLTYTGGTGSSSLSYVKAGELDDMASFRIEASTGSPHLSNVVGRGELSLGSGFVTVAGDSLVETEDYYALSGGILHPESTHGAVRIEANGEVTLNSSLYYPVDTAAYNDAYFARDTGETRWAVDDNGLFDGTFDFVDTVTNDDAETLDGLLFEDDAGDLFYVLDNDTDPGIEEGADAFHLAEVGEGWVNGESVQSAAEVDAFIDDNGLALLGVGETTLTEHGELA